MRTILIVLAIAGLTAGCNAQYGPASCKVDVATEDGGAFDRVLLFHCTGTDFEKARANYDKRYGPGNEIKGYATLFSSDTQTDLTIAWTKEGRALSMPIAVMSPRTAAPKPET